MIFFSSRQNLYINILKIHLEIAVAKHKKTNQNKINSNVYCVHAPNLNLLHPSFNGQQRVKSVEFGTQKICARWPNGQCCRDVCRFKLTEAHFVFLSSVLFSASASICWTAAAPSKVWGAAGSSSPPKPNSLTRFLSTGYTHLW